MPVFHTFFACILNTTKMVDFVVPTRCQQCSLIVKRNSFKASSAIVFLTNVAKFKKKTGSKQAVLLPLLIMCIIRKLTIAFFLLQHFLEPHYCTTLGFRKC